MAFFLIFLLYETVSDCLRTMIDGLIQIDGEDWCLWPKLICPKCQQLDVVYFLWLTNVLNREKHRNCAHTISSATLFLTVFLCFCWKSFTPGLLLTSMLSSIFDFLLKSHLVWFFCGISGLGESFRSFLISDFKVITSAATLNVSPDWACFSRGCFPLIVCSWLTTKHKVRMNTVLKALKNDIAETTSRSLSQVFAEEKGK